MKYFFPILLFFMICHCTSSAQYQSDSIEIRRSAGVKYYQNDYQLTQQEVLSVMKKDNIAYSEMQIARQESISAIVFGAAGGFLVGYQVGKLIADRYPKLVWIGVGSVLILISVPISASSYKHAKIAVDFYNSGLKQSAFHKVEYRIGLTGNGLGLNMRF
jgi:hypothetical protein